MLTNYLAIKITIIAVALVIRYAIKASRKSKPFVPPPGAGDPSANPPAFPNYQQQPFANTPQQDAFAGNQQQRHAAPVYQQSSGASNDVYVPKAPAASTASEYYCRYCGKRFQSVAALRMDSCFRHPDTSSLQKHVLYEGVGKPPVTF